jgi:hypothetical protein
MNPALVVPFSHAWTTAVASTDTQEPAVATETPLATAVAGVMPVLPLTEDSAGAPFATQKLMAPTAVSLLTKSVRVVRETAVECRRYSLVISRRS